MNRIVGRGGRYGLNLLGQALGRGIYLLAGFAAFVMVANGAGPVVLGEYGLVLAVVALAAIGADFGTTLAFGARIGADASSGVRGGAADTVGAMLSARLILGAAAGLCLLALLPAMPEATRPALALAALGMPVLAARFLDPLFQVREHPGWSAWPSLAHAGVLVGGTGWALHAAPSAAVLGAVAVFAGIVYGAVGLLLAARLVPLRPVPWRVGLAFIRTAAGVGFSNALGAINARVGLVLVAGIAGAAEAGRFTAGYRFFELGAALAVTLAAPLVPVFGRAAGAGPRPDLVALRAQVRLALRLTLAVGGPGVIAAWILAGPAIDGLFGPGFAESAPVLRIAAVMSLVMLAATLLFAALVALGRTGFAVLASGAACTINGAGCALLVPTTGALGAVAAALAAEIVMLLVVGAAFVRAAGAPLTLADGPAILVPILLTGLVALACPAHLAPYAVPLVALLAAGASLALAAPPRLTDVLPSPEASS